MKSRHPSKHAALATQRRSGHEERAQRAALAQRRKALQDRESWRQVDEFLHGGTSARA